MSRESRIKFLYDKYLNRSSSEAELEEMFALLKEKDGFESVREVLRENWKKDNRNEVLASLDWETFISRVRVSEVPVSVPKAKRRTLLIRISVAAGLLLLLGVAAWTWMHRQIITIYETGYGEVKEIVLDDNSIVRMNANSKLYWDSNWYRRGVRNVRINGEAFFNVAHMDGRRFFVNTSDLTIMVTGTAFNVTSRRDETKVYLESGEVYLQLNRENEDGDSGLLPEKAVDNTGLRMTPGEKLIYSTVTEKLQQENNLTVEQAASWKTGELIFKGIPLRDVLQELTDVYGKSFVVQDSTLFDKIIDVGMPYSDWETVKELMGFMINVKITESENKVHLRRIGTE